MNKEIEEIIKSNLPEKKKIGHILKCNMCSPQCGFNQALSQINTSLIADEVLKVVVEKIIKENYWNLLDQEEFNRRLRNLLTNSSTLEGEQSEHLSTNKENKNNE